jgi:MFS family permease
MLLSGVETNNLQWTFLTFFAIFELGSAICGAAQSSTMLIIGRAVAGMGGSGLMNGGLSILASSAPLHKRPGMLYVVCRSLC